MPTESCDVHYQGNVCMATGLPACATCPYRVPGVIEIPPAEDGTTITAGTQCPHTMEYLINNPGAAITDSQAAQQNAINANNPALQQPVAPPPTTPSNDPAVIVPEVVVE